MRDKIRPIIFFNIMLITTLLNTVSSSDQTDQNQKYNCTITSFNHIYFATSSGLNQNSKIIQRSDCPADINQKFSTILFNYSGKIKSSYLTNSNIEQFAPYKVRLYPEWISVKSIKQIVNGGSVLKHPWFISNLSMIGKSSVLTSKIPLQFDFNCINCDRPGNRSLKMSIHNPQTGRKDIHWLSALVGKRTQALVTVRDIGVNNQKLDSSYFRIKTITATSENSQGFFLELNKLKFYKLNKPLTANSPLRGTDLISIPLIQMGDMVKTTFKKGPLTLRGMARATERGDFGDLIQLKSMDGKKQLMGKVTDYKQVEVKL